MYDKTVRRRRAVLALLVALSLILLTAYFGEGAAGGGLHTVQRGFLTVVSPIQDGASRALKPVRDLFGWVGDTLNAKGQRDKLRKQVQVLTAQDALDAAGAVRGTELEKLMGLDTQARLDAYRPIAGTVVSRSSNLWFSHVGVNRGSASGIHLDNPVVNADGLVGKVTFVAPDSAVVTLITDGTSGVSAKDVVSNAAGVVLPAVGDPSDLTMQFVQSGDQVHAGDMIVTAGTVDTTGGPARSLFPPNIPIGRVTRVDSGGLFQGVHLSPMANMRDLDVLQVLTRAGSA
ncbi:MAG: rod shape-determining protein MreC [Solirubrobacteraceae bacterium]